MSKHVFELWVSRDGYNCSAPCNLHFELPVLSKNSGAIAYGNPIYSFSEDKCIEMFGFVPEPGKYKKIRATVEETPDPPPKPRLCWFVRNGVKWSGFSVNAPEFRGLFKMKSEAGIFDGFTGNGLKHDGIEIHWYDEEENIDDKKDL